MLDNESVEVSLRLKNISLKNALNLILNSNESLQWRIESGVIKIGTEEDKNEELMEISLAFTDIARAAASSREAAAATAS